MWQQFPDRLQHSAVDFVQENLKELERPSIPGEMAVVKRERRACQFHSGNLPRPLRLGVARDIYTRMEVNFVGSATRRAYCFLESRSFRTKKTSSLRELRKVAPVAHESPRLFQKAPRLSNVYGARVEGKRLQMWKSSRGNESSNPL